MGIGDRIQVMFDAVATLAQRAEVFALAVWASLSVIALVLFGLFTLWKTIMWIKDKPPAKEIRDELGRLLLAGGMILINVGLPLGLIALIPGAGNLVRDFFGALIGS